METTTQDKLYKRAFYIAVVIILLLLIGFGTYWQIDRKNDQIQENLISSLNASMRTFKDKDGLNHSERQIIETLKPEDFLDLTVKDKEIQKLQRLVKQYKNQLGKQGSVAIISTETAVDTTYEKATTIKDENFTYKDSINNKWLFLKYDLNRVAGTNPKVHLSLKVTNEYFVINKEEKQGWFKRPKYYAEVVNKNPYSRTLSQTTYQVTNDYRPKNWHIGPGVFYGISEDFQPQVFAGFGVMWTPLNF